MNEVVLVVDDLRIIRDPIAATLTAAGYRALCAANGKEALELLKGHQVELILLDVKMPVMDGLTFLRKLRGDPSTSGIPVIMLSGAEDRQDILQAAKLGIRGYVLKSHFSLKNLIGRVTDHFSLHAVASATPRQQPADAPHPSTACGSIQPAGAHVPLPGALNSPAATEPAPRPLQTDL